MTQDVTANPTVKIRYLLPNGNVAEFFLFGNTTPEQRTNLLEDALAFDTEATEKGYLSANQTAGARAVAVGKADSLKEQLRVRPENKLFHCIQMDVEPQRDGRVKVSFYGNEHKQPLDDFPSATLWLSPEDMVEALAPYYKFKVGTFRKLGAFAVDFYVETYRSSKTNTQGNPYWNVPKGGIKVLDGAEPPAIVEYAPPPPEEPQEPDDIPF